MCPYEYDNVGDMMVIARKIETIFAYSAVGSNAHNVISDLNLDDDNIRWCLDTAIVENIHEANPSQLSLERDVLASLLRLDMDQRWYVFRIVETLTNFRTET